MICRGKSYKHSRKYFNTNGNIYSTAFGRVWNIAVKNDHMLTRLIYKNYKLYLTNKQYE